MPNSVPLDVHAHLIPIDQGRLNAFQGVEWHAERNSLHLDGQEVAMRGLFDPSLLIARMDRHGVERAWVSVPPPAYRQRLNAPQALSWATYLNDGLLRIAKESGGRLGALFYLPLEHPEIHPSLQGIYQAGSYEGIAMSAGGHPRIVLSEERYESLWKWLDELEAFVFLHPGTCADPRLARFYLENLVGNPMETGIAAAHLVMAGVPGRYPGIRFCLAHAGGAFSSLVGRMERGFETGRPWVDRGVERPLQAARRFYVDGIAHHPGLLRTVREIHGDDHVLYGSDWPFPMGLPHD